MRCGVFVGTAAVLCVARIGIAQSLASSDGLAQTSIHTSIQASVQTSAPASGPANEPAAAHVQVNARSSLPVRVDPRMELMAIVFRLIEAGEYREQIAESSYSRAVDEHFAKYADHPVTQMARELRKTQGIGFDAVANFAPYLRDIETCEFVVPLDPIPANLTRWTPESAHAFAQVLKQFARDAKFDEFWKAQAPFRAKAEERMSETLSRKPYRLWIESFFGQPLQGDSTVIIGLLNGNGNYGCSVQREDGISVFPTIGVWKWDEHGVPVFEENIANTVVHEFCHPFVNPIVDAHFASFAPAGEWLKDRRGLMMRMQAYADSRAILYESLVRACVTSILWKGDGEQRGRDEQAHEVSRGFLYTPLLVRTLERYHADRVKYPTLDSFAFEMARELRDVASRPSPILSQVPKLVSISPEDGSKELPREVTFILTFDQPMNPKSRGLSFDGIEFEKVGDATLDESGKVYTVTHRFPAGAQVMGWLNRGGWGMTTLDGFAAEETMFSFSVQK